ncbi:MAG: small multi-drug export protein [candidate division WOR-3 bacterium]|nr:small multi-drug export protein [candidate division WOR-3 bacterium]MCX7836635.1 small multi-drug export protein [candidate division WOR-3 bacterium]MDW8113317.1 small multi-drug export protein [candidate division WOR-3 bacterium]
MKKIFLILFIFLFTSSLFASSWDKRIINYLESKNIKKELIVLIIAALPIVELRGALPIALHYFHIPFLESIFLSVIGNLLPILPILFILKFFVNLLTKISVFKKFFDWLFLRTRKKSKIIEKYEILGLIIFVGIPLPTTGAWTGALASFILGLNPFLSFFAISLGVLIACGIVSIFCLLGKIGAIIAGIILFLIIIIPFLKK